MLKKTISLALAIVLAFGVYSIAALAADTPSSWADADVEKAIAADLVPEHLRSDYSQPVTRAEFCALTVAMFEKYYGAEITGRRAFIDTDDESVEKAASIGVVNGVGDGMFDPGANLNREQAAVMLVRLADKARVPFADATASYTDYDTISPWAVNAVGQMQNAGIMDGVEDSAFAPNGDCTREQCIIMILRVYESAVAGEAARREGFTDIPVVIGEGTDFPLNGILSMPDDVSDKVPAVVLVHGSGPQDMDETIFENKPFRDIAEYLAANGIAVLRYDKRTLVYGAEMVEKFGGSLSVYEESIEDAILASEMLKSDPRIDGSRVFILGHSEGGMLAARIHAEGGDFAGLILLAGSPRSMLDISYDQQMAYIEAMPAGDEKSAALAQMATYDDQVAALRSLSDDEAKSVAMPGGISFYYYKDMDDHPASSYIPDITVPFLVLQGSNDFQVYADKDFIMWQELFEGRTDAAFKLYDGLNHLFMPSSIGNIMELQQEYQIVSQVDAQVIADIAEWIKAV